MARALLLASLCCVACGGKSTATRADGAPTGMDTVPAEATLELDRTRVDLGRVVLGDTVTATLTMTNRGAAASGVPTVSAQGPHSSSTGTAAPITITGCEMPLPPGGSCVLTLGVSPTALGLFDGNLSIRATPGTQNEHNSPLSAYLVGTAVGFDVTPPDDIELGDVVPGVSIRRNFTVTASIDLTDLTSFSSGAELSIDRSASTCTAMLPEGASCEIAVVFAAPTIGWKEGFLRIRAGGEFGQFENIPFTANASQSSSLTIAPTTPTTLTCVWGELGPPVVFAVTNLSATTSGPIAAAVIGGSSERLVVSATDCSVLAPQASCTVTVLCDGTGPSAAFPQGVLTVTDGSTHLSVPLTVTFVWS